MPRDGSNIYHIPLGTEGVPDTTIESNKYNTFAHDIERDLNTPRPIVSGGTGSTSPDGALAALNAEKAGQFVTNFDSFAWLAGSFYSDITATAAPVAAHAFSGIAYISNPTTMVVEARDMTDPGNAMYVRVKTAGVWGAWITDNASQYVKKTGDVMTGPLTLSGNPTAPLHAAPKQYVDSVLAISDSPPSTTGNNQFWWESDGGQLYIRYVDADSAQWVIASPVPDITEFVQKGGDIMTGRLTLAVDPVAALDATTKQYVDAAIALGSRTGTVRFTLCDVAEVGWRLFDDGTIGDPSSGSTFANVTALNLFTLMFTKFADANAPILTSTGAATTRAAQTDAPTAWAAHCRMSLPKTLGRALGVAGSGAGLTARPAGSIAGEEKHTPVLIEMFNHAHDVYDPTHVHPITGSTINTGGASVPAAGPIAFGPATMGYAATGIGIYALGGGVPFNVVSPVTFLNAEVKL
jgi:hypothetical protein